MSDIKYFNEALTILNKKKIKEVKNLEFLEYPDTSVDLEAFLNSSLYSYLSPDEIIQIYNYIIIRKNANYGVFINNKQIKAILPEVETKKDTLISIHEITHLINLVCSKNYIFSTMYTEIIPIFNEIYYLYKNNFDYKTFIRKSLNDSILKYKNNKFNTFNILAHLYAYIIINDLINYNSIDLDDCFIFLNDINLNSENLSYDLESNSFFLSKKMLKNL